MLPFSTSHQLFEAKLTIRLLAAKLQSSAASTEAWVSLLGSKERAGPLSCE
jgi:hypothetical protein